jgi:translation elongation factor EF-Tu-like GTPase
MKPDFIATLYYKTSEEGGRNTPAQSGYRPTVKFPFDEMFTGSIQNFLDKESVKPGEVVEAQITIIATPYFKGKLSEGIDFVFTEGLTIIGTGVIKEILNKDLLKIERG